MSLDTRVVELERQAEAARKDAEQRLAEADTTREELERRLGEAEQVGREARDAAEEAHSKIPTGPKVDIYERHPHDLGKHTGGVIAARVYNSGAITISTSVSTALTFDSERYDTDSIHDTGSNTSRLTCKTAGKYDITGNIEWAQAGAAGRLLIIIRVNGSTQIGGTADLAEAMPNLQSVSTDYDLAVDDYVELVVRQETGGDVNILAASNYSPEFMMKRTGAAGSSGGGAPGSAHADLTGLGNDDHSQYLLAAGTRALTGNWDVGAYEVRAKSFKQDLDNSKITVGTGNDGEFYSSGDDVHLHNVTQDADLVFGIDDGGVSKTITWDANVDRLKHSAGLFHFDNDNITTTGTITGNNVVTSTQAITNNAILTVDHAAAADNDYAKFTAAGLEGRSYAEVLSDIGAAAASHAMSTHSDEDTYNISTSGTAQVTGEVGLNVAPLSGRSLFIKKTGTLASGFHAHISLDSDATLATGAQMLGMHGGGAYNLNGNNPDYIYGFQFNPQVLNSTATNSTFSPYIAMNARIRMVASSTGWLYVDADCVGILIDSPEKSDRCYTLRYYGLWIQDQTMSTSTTYGATDYWGVKIDEYTELRDAGGTATALHITSPTASVGTNRSIVVVGTAGISIHQPNLRIGSNSAPSGATLHVNQASSSGAIPCLKLDQDDIDDSFIDFEGTSAADGTRSISSDTGEAGACFGKVRVDINGTVKWVRVYDDST